MIRDEGRSGRTGGGASCQGLTSVLSLLDVQSPVVFFGRNNEAPIYNEAARSCLSGGRAGRLDDWLKMLTEDCRVFLSAGTQGLCTQRELGDKCLRVTWSRVRGTDVEGALAGLADVSDLRSTQRRLKLLEEAVNHADEMVLITDTHGEILYVNETFSEQTGFEPEETVGQRPSLLKSGEQDPTMYQELWETVLSGRTWRGELINRRKNGTLYPEEMAITPVRRNGEVAHFIAIKRDISQRKQWEQRLEESRSFLQSIIDAIPVPVFAKDSYGVYTLCNHCFEELVGRPRQSVIGRTVSAFVSPEYAYIHRQQDQEILSGGSAQEYEVDLKEFGRGDAVEYRIIKAPLLGAYNQIDGIVGVMMNVSHLHRLHLLRAEAEASKRALKALDRMISIIGHELSSPVAAVKTSCALLETAQPEDIGSLAGTIDAEISQMGSFISAMVRIGQIYSGSALWNWESFDLVPLIEETVRKISEQFDDGREVSLVKNFEIDRLSMAGDRASMQQLFCGLLDNAYRYTQTGSVMIEARKHRSNGQETAEAVIRDTGPGMPAAVLDRVDDPLALSRGLPGREVTEGAGLGLPLCRAILKAHGGTWQIESDPESGTVIHIQLPLALESPLIPAVAHGEAL